MVTFESGKEYSFPRALLECDDGTELRTVKTDRRRSFFRVTQASGNRYEVPWDRVLYEADPTYAYRRRQAVKPATSLNLGRKIRKLRIAGRMTQAELARAAGMMRPNVTRIEAGSHRPTLETLEKIAAALGIPVVDLIIGAPRGSPSLQQSAVSDKRSAKRRFF